MDSLDIFEPTTNQLPSNLSFTNFEQQNYRNMKSSRVKIAQKDSIIDLLYDNNYSSNQISPNSRKDINQSQKKHNRSPSIEFIVEDLQESQHMAEEAIQLNQKKLKHAPQTKEQHTSHLSTLNKSLRQNLKDHSHSVNANLFEGNEEKQKISTTNASSIQQFSYSQVRPVPKNHLSFKQQDSESQFLGQVMSTLDNKPKQSLYQTQIEKASSRIELIKQQNQVLQNTLLYLKTVSRNGRANKMTLLPTKNSNVRSMLPLKHLLQKMLSQA